MSTFNGYVKEFPTIRIDRFRKLDEKPLPVVGLLSHIHSDHLQGLESWGRIPLFCSPTTQQLLLHLERYPHRMNFAKGILESRKQHYKHLKSVLRPLPLNTPTDIEIGLDQFIRVTLFDANHCAGAVMFLIEDEQKAVLYTGDIRAEIWWINSLVRNPSILSYSSGIKRLDNIYLDTTFASKSLRFRRFKSKASGIKELLEKMLKFPQETVFHFNAWTLGYEDVWVAISGAFNTQVHVDDYRSTLYGSLASQTSSHFQCPEGPALVGFTNGNHFQRGCLTQDRSVRLHSCEHGTGCPASSSPETVHITPIISKDENGEILPEAGVGGAGGDFLYHHAFLDLNEGGAIVTLLNLCNKKIEGLALRSQVRDVIIRAAETNEQAMLLANFILQDTEINTEMEELVEALIERAKIVMNSTKSTDEEARRIHFPYSRHSSYEELCRLVAIFQPRDIYPCTANWREWSSASSVENLFGHLCDMVLAHDQEMASMETQRAMLRSKKRIRSSSDSLGPYRSQGERERESQISGRSCERNFPHGPRPIPFSKDQSGRAEPEQTVAELRQAFEYPLLSFQGKTKLLIPTSRPKYTTDGTGALLHNALNSSLYEKDGNLQESSCNPSANVGNHIDGTQIRPFEDSDDVCTQLDSQTQGDFLLEEIPAPEDNFISDINEEPKVGSQLTLSDSNFESQLVEMLPDEHLLKLRNRKEAYEATRNFNSAWEKDHILVSVRADHGEVEVEL